MNKQFGKTDLITSPIVYGCMGGAGAFGAQDERDSIEALKEAFNVGINFFDTAEAYGNGYSEQLLGRALGDKRSELVISSKVARENLAPNDMIEACERSLKNLGTDVIDLYMLQRLPLTFELASLATTLGVRHGLVILDAQQYHSGGCLVGGTSVKGGIVFERVLICYGPVGNISASSGLFILLDMAR